MAKIEETLNDILKALKEQKEDIKDAKVETDRKLESFMNIIGTEMKGMKKGMSEMSRVMDENEKENKTGQDRIAAELRENGRRNKEYMEKMDDRIANLEEALRRNNIGRTNREGIEKTKDRQMEREKPKETRNAVFEKEKEKESKKEKERGWNEERVIPTDWTASFRKQLAEDAEKAGRETEGGKGRYRDCRNENKEYEDNTKMRKKSGMRKLKKWFCDESPINTSESESESGGEQEMWEEKVQRRERNKDRRRKNLENRRANMRETATKASRTLGLHPIENKDIEEYSKKLGDPKKAVEKVVRNYLRDYLQFNSEELKEVEINDTKVSTKGDKTVYVSFNDIENIREIHWRMGELKNKDIIVKKFIPPQFWERYIHLNRACTAYRADNPDAKTQLRFSNRDVEIMMKTKGTEEPYRKVPFSEVTDPREVPAFDHRIKWTQRNTRPLRRKLQNRENSGENDSLSQLIRNGSTGGAGAGLIRTRSDDSTTMTGKKPRQDVEQFGSGMETE